MYRIYMSSNVVKIYNLYNQQTSSSKIPNHSPNFQRSRRSAEPSSISSCRNASSCSISWVFRSRIRGERCSTWRFEAAETFFWVVVEWDMNGLSMVNLWLIYG